MISGLKVWRLLARGDYTAFVLEHLHSEPEFPTPNQSLVAIATGERSPTPGTPIPAATWTGTAAIHTINSGDVAYYANATLTVPLADDTPRRLRISYLHIDTPQPLDVDDNAPPLRAMTFPITKANDDTDQIWNPDPRLNVQASFHGTNHDVVVLVFSNARTLLIGGAILYRQDTGES